jgi:hypothetical protein
LTIDSKFIGSSQSGRTYAGSVRSKDCSVLADSRVSDTCRACANLRNIVINRSVLASPGKLQTFLSDDPFFGNNLSKKKLRSLGNLRDFFKFLFFLLNSNWSFNSDWGLNHRARLRLSYISTVFFFFRIPKFDQRKFTPASTAAAATATASPVSTDSIECLEGGGDQRWWLHLPMSPATVVQYISAASGNFKFIHIIRRLI